jgi:tricorn protease
MTAGYYRFPTIHEDTVVFVCEDDLWTSSANGGIARRLTANRAEVTRPSLSPDGQHLAFVGREEGHSEIFAMPAAGGPSRRLTYLGDSDCQTAGWTEDGRILFAHSAGQPFASLQHLHTQDLAGSPPQPLNIGPARAISFGPGNGVIIGRNNNNPARWKRYRGGTAGQIWIDEQGDGQFRHLIDLQGNLDSPIWLGDRIYFLSDHEGIGNLYSCLPSGAQLQRHTGHDDFYARNASSDGRRIVYHAGADLFLFDPARGQSTKIQIDFHSPQTQRNRKFVSASRYLGDWTLHPAGHAVAITTRGKPFTFANWEGAVLQYEPINNARYRLLEWLNDGERLIAVSDAGGEENFVIIQDDGRGLTEQLNLDGLDIGRPLIVKVNPKKDKILFTNHRYELLCLDLESKELTLIDRGQASRIAGFNWSPDGQWVVYSVSISLQVSVLKLWRAETREITMLTRPVLQDIEPAFDPAGKYIFFLSHREFDPVYDNMHFDLNFPQGMRPYMITLQEDLTSPFIPVARAPGQTNGKDKKNNDDDKQAEKNNEQKNETPPLRIDLDGIENRIIPFPVEEGRYGRILGTADGKAVYSRYPVEGALNQSWLSKELPAKGVLFAYDFKQQKEERLLSKLTDFALSRDAKTLIYRAGNRLRVLKAGSKADDKDKDTYRKNGWLDLSRVKVSISPAQEWQQMYREAWRLQRDQFWTQDMSQIDWLTVYERYLPLVSRVASRSEFSDLAWEMQGELGTSHAYEFGGDYRPQPNYNQGYLGADFTYAGDSEGWQITRIVQGDVWDEKADSPLNAPGINVKAGDRLLAVNGRRLHPNFSPQMALVDLAGQEILLTIASSTTQGEDKDQRPRNVSVKALRDETAVRYREWVENNRRYVHEATQDRIGYVHIPDMGPRGYAEFHRAYLSEVDRQGLIVDVRYNGGGHVSALILEKLARRRVGYDISRWGQIPYPYPGESVLGPIVALTNEFAGSDGDIFSHSFKLMGLGPLIGTRTWGGVIGIYPRHQLVDGTITTQPEFSFWFQDVGWGVENYGTDPDIQIDNRPQDFARGVDAQLERTITEIQTMLAKNPPIVPDFGQRPRLSLPKLSPRNNQQ